MSTPQRQPRLRLRLTDCNRRAVADGLATWMARQSSTMSWTTAFGAIKKATPARPSCMTGITETSSIIGLLIAGSHPAWQLRQVNGP